MEKGTLQKISEPPAISEGTGDGEGLHYNAVLIGNSKSIWPKFIAWLTSQYEKRLEKNGDHCDKDEIFDQVLNENPFDTFVTETLSQVFQLCCSVPTEGGVASQLSSYEFYWSNGVHYKVDLDDITHGTESAHRTNGNYHCYASQKSSFLVSMQRVAKATGEYWHDDEGTKLCVHPKFGTWKAFRAVVVFHKMQKAEEPQLSIPKAPPLCPCPVAAQDIQKAKEVMDYALKMSAGENGDHSGYGGSSTYANLCTYLHNSVTSGSDWSKVSPTMRPWIQLRDCISLGREDYKYCDNQLLYHYTKDPEILKREIKR